MEKTTYIKCRSPIMTYVDPQTRFMIPRGKIVALKGPPTKTMRRWIRRGGLKVVEEALYVRQQERIEASTPSEKPLEPAVDVAPESPEPAEEKAPAKKSNKKKTKKTK